MRISDWSSDVCSSDLRAGAHGRQIRAGHHVHRRRSGHRADRREAVMPIGRLNHVGVATPSIEKSVEMYVSLLGATKVNEPFDLPPQGVRVCFVDPPNRKSSEGRRGGKEGVST